MSSVDGGRRGPFAALKSRWWLGIILVMVGAAAGLAVGSQRETLYTAESRLIVGSNDLSSYQVAGFATASQQLASNYARFVDNSSTVSDSLQRDLGKHNAELTQISASPIPQSSVVSVQTVATTRAIALAAARSVAKTLVALTATATADDPGTLLKAYMTIAKSAVLADDAVTKLTSQLATAQAAKKSTDALETSLSAAKLRANILDLQRSAAGTRYQNAVTEPSSQSQLQLVQVASIVDENRSQTLQIYTAGGAITGLVLALIISAVLERRASRTRRAGRHDIDGDFAPNP